MNRIFTEGIIIATLNSWTSFLWILTSDFVCAWVCLCVKHPPNRHNQGVQTNAWRDFNRRCTSGCNPSLPLKDVKVRQPSHLSRCCVCGEGRRRPWRWQGGPDEAWSATMVRAPCEAVTRGRSKKREQRKEDESKILLFFWIYLGGFYGCDCHQGSFILLLI